MRQARLEAWFYSFWLILCLGMAVAYPFLFNKWLRAYRTFKDGNSYHDFFDWEWGLIGIAAFLTLAICLMIAIPSLISSVFWRFANPEFVAIRWLINAATN